MARVRRARVFAPATIGNVGPGFDVLGVAVAGLGDEVEITLDVDRAECIVTGRDAELVPRGLRDNAAAIAARAFLDAKKHTRPFALAIHKGLPLSGGLGGSAASSVGGALAAALALGKPFTDEAVLVAAAEGEAAVAGWHFDNLAPCYFGGLTLVLPTAERVLPEIVRLRSAGNLWVALASPHVRVETKHARAVLPAESPRAAWVRQMARTSALVVALSRGDTRLLSLALHDEIVEPARAPLIPGFLAAKRAALAAGALGCSISGAGPTTFALATDERRARRVAKAMAQAYAMVGASLHVAPLSRRGAHRVAR